MDDKIDKMIERESMSKAAGKSVKRAGRKHTSLNQHTSSAENEFSIRQENFGKRASHDNIHRSSNKRNHVKGRTVAAAHGHTKKHKTKKRTYIQRVLVTLGVTLVLLFGGLYAVMCMLVYGPSPTAKNLFVMSVRETSAMGFLANWFFSEDQIKEIIAENSIQDTDEITNTNLVEVSAGASADTSSQEDAIQVVDIKGSTYRGKLMIVKDPSRVFVGTVPEFTEGDGMVVSDIASRYNAVAGVNAGEFVDGGTTYTAMPVGLVMTNGEITNGDPDKTWHVTGITNDNILVVGNMNGQQAKDLGIRDCVSVSDSIGPFLIINGEAQNVGGIGGGLNPRTAIGQRADGAILLLVVDGRQANSLGASFADLLDVMQQYGAVNASTMDGGTSTQMFYNGEVINTPYSPVGPRKCPTSFLVGGVN